MEAVMATAASIVYPHITKDPEVRAGKACIDGTRLAVVDIVLLLKRGLSVEEMCHYYVRPLTPAQVHAALLYYYEHTDEIEAYFERYGQAADELKAERDEYLRRHAAQ
jgi:uncharacterized protein (DUF433 family)